ncbi:MAG: SPOUT family RNA methylase [Nitrososphaerota archaeon]
MKLEFYLQYSLILVEAEASGDIKSIVEAVRKIIRDRISPEESFAVRTVRRGKHDFTSIDVNVVVGAVVKQEVGARVDLENPDKIIQIEIINDKAGIAITDGFRWKKMSGRKKPSIRFFNKISIVQMPYLGSLEGAREIGARIGRAVQAYEVNELVIAPSKPVDAEELARFIEGVLEGVESRYVIQKKSYARDVRKVRVLVQDLYQLVRDRRGEPIIVFEPEGVQLRECREKLRELFIKSKRVNFLLGSREGIPKGVYRIADMVVDLAPGITLPTELAAPVALASVYITLHTDYEYEILEEANKQDEEQSINE